MNLHRIVVLSLVLSLSVLLTVTAQSPTSTRGKNGGVQERKPGETPPESVQAAPHRQPAIGQSQQGSAQTIGDSTDKGAENIRLAVDLVVLDAQVLQHKTGRIVGNLTKEDFVLAEDGVRQQVTQFSQDTLPLSVILLIDRGGCLDPFSEKVRHATLAALERLRPQDEVALMSFANTTDLVTGFGRGKERILAGLDHLPPHDENAD